MSPANARALSTLLTRVVDSGERVEVHLPGDREVHSGRFVGVEIDGFALALDRLGRRVVRVTAGGRELADLPAWFCAEDA